MLTIICPIVHNCIYILFFFFFLIHVVVFCHSGNFNIFCDPTENQAVKPAANAIHNSASVHRNVPEAPVPHNPPSVPLSARTGQAELDTITPNQSLNLNASSANPDNKTPQASCLSDKTPSSASFSSAPRSARMGRLSNIRTPKGLTAPSPTINTREAMGVITAMLDSSLENNLFGWDGPNPAKVSSHDKDFEMDFANTGPSGENNKPIKSKLEKLKHFDCVVSIPVKYFHNRPYAYDVTEGRPAALGVKRGTATCAIAKHAARGPTPACHTAGLARARALTERLSANALCQHNTCVQRDKS